MFPVVLAPSTNHAHRRVPVGAHNDWNAPSNSRRTSHLSNANPEPFLPKLASPKFSDPLKIDRIRPEKSPLRRSKRIDSYAQRHFMSKTEQPASYPLIERLPSYQEPQEPCISQPLCEVKPMFEPVWLPPTTNFPALTFPPEFGSLSEISQSVVVAPQVHDAPLEQKPVSNEDCLCKTAKRRLSQAWAFFSWMIGKTLAIPGKIVGGLQGSKPRRY